MADASHSLTFRTDRPFEYMAEIVSVLESLFGAAVEQIDDDASGVTVVLSVNMSSVQLS